MSAPENRAPLTLAPLKFTFLKWARSKQTFERSHRKNSTPLACAPVRSAPGRIASVMSVFLKSALRSRAPERSAPGSRAVFKSDPSKFAFLKIAPEKFKPDKSAFERSAPVRSARAPPSFPRKKSSCASRISANFFPLCLMLFGFLNPISSPVSNDLDLYPLILLELAGSENPQEFASSVDGVSFRGGVGPSNPGLMSALPRSRRAAQDAASSLN